MNQPMPIVDAWVQPPLPGFLQHSMFESLRRWGTMQVTDTPPLARTLAALDAGGVTRALACAWWGPEGAIIGNDVIAEFVTAHPDRFGGVASVDLMRPMEAVRELRRCVRDLGFVALRVLPWMWDLPPNDRRYYPLYAECVELGIPFCLQVGHTGPMRSSDPGRPIPYLDQVALDFPELTIIGGHIGFPWTAEMISLAIKYPNVYIDTSAYKPRRYPRDIVDFMRGYGRKKVLFGSNFPMLEPADCLAQVDDLGLDDEAKRLFLSENALRVFAKLTA